MRSFYPTARPLTRARFLLTVGIFIMLCVPIIAQNTACPYNDQTLQFAGNPLEQAQCLLRPNKPRGILLQQLKELPKSLAKLIGTSVRIKKDRLRKYLRKHNLDEAALGGNLDDPLSTAKLPNGTSVPALYFIIHDTSTPNYGKGDFPKEINEKDWKFNNLEMWLKNPVAHIFVNRLGESITTTPFSEPVRKGWGTKFARDFLKADGKGLQLHIELCQPRRSNPEWFDGNDEIAPEPGFTDEQYARLALLYVTASIRRGTWLIPAFHCAIDAGIKDAHDDPQNFNLEMFAGSLKNLTDTL